MFTLLQGLWKYFFRKDEYYVVILGLDNAGKTVNYCREPVWSVLPSLHSSPSLDHSHFSLSLSLSLFPPSSPPPFFAHQTFLEKTKSLFVRNYSGMPLEKITSTVGLNGTTLCTLWFIQQVITYQLHFRYFLLRSLLCIVARVDISSARLIFWDLGGQEDLQTLWDKVWMYYSEFRKSWISP